MEVITPVLLVALPAEIAGADGISGVEEAFTRVSEPLKKKQRQDEETQDGSMPFVPPLIPRQPSQLNDVSRYFLVSRMNGLTSEIPRRVLQADRFERLQSSVFSVLAKKEMGAIRSLELTVSQSLTSASDSSVQKTTQPLFSGVENLAQKITQQIQGKEPLALAVIRSDEMTERVVSRKRRSLADVGAMQSSISPQGGVRTESMRLPVSAESALPQRMAQHRTTPELPQSLPNSSANSDLVYRFQRWGGDHTVMIQPQIGGGLQLNSSDTLVHQRLDEHWSAGNPQQWQLSYDRDDGQQHNAFVQDEDEES
ncbi:SpaN/EivJ family type III secretion system needle length determinant [Plesiomonas sp.]|uniref:SpaN/EivJ family type III secretion system needle length determinant n=1 Tax=Plesiomonas sp. TaxID=2486279 RepID=UPI003F3C0B26